MFLDIFGNSIIRDKTSSYLDHVTKELIQLVTEDDRCDNVLRDIISFSDLRFKDRDDMEDIFS
jgi:dynein assembly factor 3